MTLKQKAVLAQLAYLDKTNKTKTLPLLQQVQSIYKVPGFCPDFFAFISTSWVHGMVFHSWTHFLRNITIFLSVLGPQQNII